MKRGVDDPGSYGVESNMLLCVFHRQLSGDGFKSAFGDHGNGSRNAGNRIIGQSARDTHDAAAGLLRLHLFHRKLRDVNETEKVSRYERENRPPYNQ